MMLEESFRQLREYVEKEQYQGYDPYDALNSYLPFKWLGKWGPVLAIQFQKRNPINIRPIIGIKKEINPKGFGLFLQGYSILYKKTGNKEYLEKADFFYKWLSENYTKGYSGKCWGYNFPWASSEKYLNAYIPSSVVTGFIIKGLYEYYKATQNNGAIELMKSAAVFLDKDLEKVQDTSGVSISYTPIKKDVCYNASLLAAESLAIVGSLTNNEEYKETASQAVNYVVSKQKEDGHWNYSLNLISGAEREQIDFHQGYILECIYEICKVLNIEKKLYTDSLEKGLKYYYTQQFKPGGRSVWRVPKEYPVEIHNQAQGIITFSKLSSFGEEYKTFASEIAKWTVANMQSPEGFFYYRKFKRHTHKISYMRWSNAWMFLSFCQLFYNDKN